MYPTPLAHERNADMVIHITGVLAVLIGGAYLILSAINHLDTLFIVACFIYAVFAALSFIASACYHLLPYHHWRNKLKFLDHAAIPAFQAATFTPLLMFADTTLAYLILSVMWILAGVIIFMKFQGRLYESRWSLVPNFLIGFVALIGLYDLAEYIPRNVLFIILSGFVFYGIGTIFYKRKAMPYRNAVWHSFVLFGSVAFFIAVWLTLFKSS